MDEAPTLTEREAYRAMYFFLAAHWRRTGSDDVAALLGELSLLPDGGTADPAAAGDFRDAVARAKGVDDTDFRLGPA